MILPVAVRGSVSTNSIRRGYSCAASRILTKIWSAAASAASACAPGFTTTNALTISVRNKRVLDEDWGRRRRGGARRRPGLHDHDRLDDLGAQGTGHAAPRRHRDRGMLDQTILDPAGANAITAAGDDVVVAPDEPE